jgi:DNA-binding transcriptional ArsR family regulator
MEYIEETLGLKCVRKQWDKQAKLPYYLLNEYNFEVVSIDDQECIFLKPKGNLATRGAIKKHLKRLCEQSECPVVFELAGITKQRKSSFIEAKIPFVVPGKQLYLPFVGAILRERNDAEDRVADTEKLMPSAQMLLFAFLLGKNQPLYLSDAAKRFGITAMSISRAASQLVGAGLVERKNQGVQKFIASDIPAKALFELARPRLIDPVRKEVFISRKEVTPDMFPAGLTALSEISMLNPPPMPVLGTTENEKVFESARADLVDSETSATLQIWRYNPRLINHSDKADALSLYMSLAGDHDERVEQAWERLLQEVL